VNRTEITLEAWRGALIASLVLAGSLCHVTFAQKRQTLDPSAAEQSPQQAPSQAEGELQTGIALTRSGRFAEAIPHFLVARGRVSEEYAADFNLALCYVGGGEPQKAVPILIGLRNGGHENASVENLLSQAYEGSGEPIEAFEAFQKAAAFTPKDEKLYLLVAAAFLEKEEYSEGLKVVDAGLQNLPGSAKLHYELGYALWQLEEPSLAKPELERAAALAPRSGIGYLAAAQESFLLGNISQAAQIARAAIHEGVADYQLLALLGDALIQAGASPGQPEFSEAQDALQKSVAAHANFASSQIALGRLLLQEGKLDAAIEHLELGHRLVPQNPAPCLLLATAYRKRGRIDEAQAMVALVVKLNEEKAQKRRALLDERR